MQHLRGAHVFPNTVLPWQAWIIYLGVGPSIVVMHCCDVGVQHLCHQAPCVIRRNTSTGVMLYLTHWGKRYGHFDFSRFDSGGVIANVSATRNGVKSCTGGSISTHVAASAHSISTQVAAHRWQHQHTASAHKWHNRHR